MGQKQLHAMTKQIRSEATRSINGEGILPIDMGSSGRQGMIHPSPFALSVGFV